MAKSITPNQIRQTNRQLIYHYIYEHRKVSQQELSYALHLSRPTVTSNLTELESKGLIFKDGQIDSELAGRKAAAYAIVPDHRVGIGAEITRKELKIIAVNLYGEQMKHSVISLPFENCSDYYERACEEIQYFIDSLGVPSDQILGVGIAVQGLVSPDGQTITYGKILDVTGLSVTAFSRWLPFPCRFVHDATSAAISELWVSPELQNAFYLSLSRHLGAALISRREIFSGKHGHSSTIEHIRVRPRGDLCYCGRRGCAETICSMEALLQGEESPDDFFEVVRAGDSDAVKRWNGWLSNLADVINLAHLVYDTDFILGGYLASWLEERDLRYLYKEIAAKTPFDEPQDFLRISKMPKHNITTGAALPYIRAFLQQI